MIEKIYSRIKKNGNNLTCVFMSHANSRVSVSTAKELIEKTPQANIIGFYNSNVESWMLMDDLDFFGIDYDGEDETESFEKEKN